MTTIGPSEATASEAPRTRKDAPHRAISSRHPQRKRLPQGRRSELAGLRTAVSLPEAPHPPATRAENDQSKVRERPRQDELDEDDEDEEDEELAHYALAFSNSMRSARKLTP